MPEKFKVSLNNVHTNCFQFLRGEISPLWLTQRPVTYTSSPFRDIGMVWPACLPSPSPPGPAIRQYYFIDVKTIIFWSSSLSLKKASRPPVVSIIMAQPSAQCPPTACGGSVLAGTRIPTSAQAICAGTRPARARGGGRNRKRWQAGPCPRSGWA